MLYVTLHDAIVAAQKASLMGTHSIDGIKADLKSTAVSDRRFFLMSGRCYPRKSVAFRTAIILVVYAMITFAALKISRNYESPRAEPGQSGNRMEK